MRGRRFSNSDASTDDSWLSEGVNVTLTEEQKLQGGEADRAYFTALKACVLAQAPAPPAAGTAAAAAAAAAAVAAAVAAAPPPPEQEPVGATISHKASCASNVTEGPSLPLQSCTLGICTRHRAQASPLRSSFDDE